ncbi:Cupin domain protein [Pirellulimonas nuda]|uniref:Cupin domain protein n=1 Tax=Pirellulimonas nuda TaxID=2528009 RepID=A0A518DBU5_9BACT|nr:cupin domain-containing protein [Pirellulimonas nuda]QDU88957.1 Cupin domain protein [Pirellulimonas nuda]
MLANLFADLPQEIAAELFTTIVDTPKLRIERIVSLGQASPEGFWYEQPQHEWVVLLRGAARLRFEDRTLELRPGDHVNLLSGQRHRIEWTSPDEPTVWLAVHYGSVE